MSDFRMDDAGLFLQRQLEYIRPQVFETTYADIKYPTILPVTSEAGPGAQTFTYRIMDSTGEFRLIADAADDLPRADVSQVEKSLNIRSIGGSFGYTVQELRAAQMANVALEQRRAAAVRRAYEEKVEQIALFGESSVSLAGFFNNATVDVVAADRWFTGSTASGTAQDMIELLNYGVTAIINGSKMKETPDTILMSWNDYNKVSTTRFSDSSDLTVLEYFLRTNPFINNVEPINQLDKANTTYLNTNRMVVYKRDPEKVQLHIPQPLELFPPQQRGLEFIVPAHARVGGVALYYPKSVIYVQASA